MIRFNCDYCEDAHERMLRELAETNLERTPGYGEDHYCTEAAGIICSLCGQEDVAIHFLMGGAQANMVVTTSALRSHQGVAGTVTAHINVHETGSIEATDHKVLALPSEDGKITAEQMEGLYQTRIRDESFKHTVQPKIVYISNPTKLGTIYTRSELGNLYEVCRRYRLYLFVDGARLAYGLAAEGNDLGLKSLAAAYDISYIGGTKAGALFGKAVVILNDELKADFHYHIKQRGGMLVRGHLLSIQFGELLRDGLHFELGAHVDRLADKIRCAYARKGYSFLAENTANQIFPIMPDSLLESWKDKYSYTNQGRVDEGHTAIRLCTSWITGGEQVGALINDILNS